ncbi:regulator of volume decrease after cellular swelling-domain-containing protein [Aspergillus welwitschiae]|uniref:Regulator of volume decrease after cellular swelling-domain-containing protein n=1 Tax=Aspergillus welwitschiae TaxID=1341132 RepID=A0A3F3Q323_9EURO|nr:regulator of volume decrease after cellular swelling-domain-containing protein [Aspergillus welwitschiae]RDH33624.1 regulator of volume decrease after cellular swelling-domain-containing protein [Aspergillus welwitschiae]
MESIAAPPDTTTFIPLAEHQSRTPSSFHSGPPILYSHHHNCKLVLLEREALAVPALGALREASTANGTTEEEGDKEIVISGVNVWVTSEKFLLHNPTTNTGLSIPYPSISLHAIQRLQLPSSEDQVQGLYMQIANPTTSSYSSADDEEDALTVTVVPETPTQESSSPAEEGDEKPETPTQTLYAAVSACSNLHPDPVEPGDEDEDDYEGEEGAFQSGLVSMGSAEGGLPPPVEGSSGWITAENMHEFFDEEGNWIAGGEEPTLPLGPGAGTVRQREEDEGAVDGQEGVNGDGNGGEETKWRRTD